MHDPNRRRLIAAGTLALAGLAGCLGGGDADDDPSGDGSSGNETDGGAGDPAESRLLSADVDRADPDVPAADVEALVEGNTAFALEVLSTLAEDGEENLFFSPFSVSLALAMTWAGARGDTERAMADALSFPHDQETLHPAFNALWRDAESEAGAAGDGGGEGDEAAGDEGDGGGETAGDETDGDGDGATEFALEIANAIWGQEGYPFAEDFLETLARNYGAGLRTLDFEAEPEGARETVNEWVADETDDHIDELLPPGSIEPETRLVLTNAIYFVANWATRFDEEETEEGTFTALDGTESEVPLMSQHLRTSYASVDGHEVIELPYAGDATMVVFLPAEGAFERFRDDLDAASVAELLEATGDASGDLALPRFEFETSVGLERTLSALGMGEAFSEAANFSGMTDEEALLIDDVYHDAYVAVDEEGTEAAAATGAVMMPTSAPPETFDVVVDRPFVFAIRDDDTGSLLFLGQVVDAGAAQ